jgi:hypothetical protein
MLSSIGKFVADAWLSFLSLNYFLRFPILIVAGITAVWISWRTWRFSIYPLLHPEEPREVPYAIPFLGHARSFLKNQDKALSYGREYFKGSREPFAFTLGREKLYILTSYQDVATAYRNTTVFDYGDVIQDLMGSFGVSRPGIDKVYAPNPKFEGEIHRYNPRPKSLFHLKSDFYHTQLHPGEQFKDIQDKFLHLIGDALKFENLAQDITFTSTINNVSLYKLCQQVFVKAGIRAFFGERILQLSPSFVQDFIDFDDNNWMIFYNWPDAALARNSKSRVLATLEAYLKLPKTDRPGAAWLIEMMEESQRQLGMSEADIAVVLMMLMWV